MAGHGNLDGRLTRRSALGAMAGAAALGGAPVAGAGEARRVLGRIKQSLSHWCYGKVKIEDLAREAARIGYRSIEMSGADTWTAIKKHGLAIAIIGGHGTLTNGLNRRENHDRIEKEIRRNIDVAVENGIPSLICFSGNRGGISDDEGAKNTADGLKRVAGYAEEKKITLCLELLNSKVDHKDYQADHTSWGVDVCKRVGSPRVKLLYDVYHMQIMEGDLIRTIRSSIEYIGHFHTGGNPGRNDIDDTQEIHYPAVMRAIAETKYDGYVSHEFVPKGKTPEEIIAAIEKAFAICDV